MAINWKNEDEEKMEHRNRAANEIIKVVPEFFEVFNVLAIKECLCVDKAADDEIKVSFQD